MSKEKIIAMASRVWLIGAITRAGFKTLSQAFYEFLYVIAWSILPFLLGGLVLYVTSEADTKSFFSLAKSTLMRGELLVFTISMLAPTLYFALHDPEKADAFPHRLSLSTISMLIIVACAALFALIKAGSIRDGEFVFSLSVTLTIAALFFRYLAMVYHRIRQPDLSEKYLRHGQEDFVDAMKRHVETQK